MGEVDNVIDFTEVLGDLERGGSTRFDHWILPDGLLTHLADAEEVDLMAYPMTAEGEQD